MTWNLSRDPALFGALILAVVQLVLTLTGVAPDTAALVSAVVAAAVGFAVALAVRSDRWVPALLGLLKASGALLVGLGLAWSTADQAAVMIVAAAASAMFTRSQVVAPVGQVVARRGPVVVEETE